MENTGQRIAPLDGLRGMAALMVAISHFSNRTEMLNTVLGNGAGALGVVLFFVLSGFLMGHLYREQPFTRENVLGFAQRRFARIAPLFVAVLLLTLVIYWSPLRQFAVISMPVKVFFRTLFLWQGTGIFWTIPVEVQFYLVFPLIWLLSAKLPRAWLPVIVLVAVTLLLVHHVKHPVLLHFGAAFFVGVIAAAIKVRIPPLAANVLFVACLGMVALLYPGLWRAVGARNLEPFHSVIHMLVFGGLIWSAARSSIADAVFGSAPGRFLGSISFSLYLLHYMVFRILEATPLSHNVLVFLVSFLFLAILVAWLSYRFIEAPARRWLSGRKAPRPPDNPVVAAT